MIIRTNDLSKKYKIGLKTVNALNGINLDVNEGEFVVVMGTSGSGKSTLLHMIGCLDQPTGGTIEIAGTDISQLSDRELSELRRDRIGFVFQEFNLINELNVRENVMLPILLSGNKPDEEGLMELFKTLDIAERLTHTPLELSGGQQQRVAIARALANNPDVILCDEPTGNLDKKNSEDVVNLLQTIHRKYNKTIVMVTHDANIARVANRIIQLEDGKIISDILK